MMSNGLNPGGGNSNSQDQTNRDVFLDEARKTQPYLIEDLRGFRIRVDKDTFPPDLGYTTLLMADAVKDYSGNCALDMGTGTGFLAMMLHRAGYSTVTAADHHQPAVDCARYNIASNRLSSSVKVLKSDLFSDLLFIGDGEGERYDLIVFNQPYYPAICDVIFGMGSDGGSKIIERFLTQALPHLNNNGAILMTYSDIAGEINNPKLIAEKYGWSVKIVRHEFKDGQNHYIYEIKPACYLPLLSAYPTLSDRWRGSYLKRARDMMGYNSPCTVVVPYSDPTFEPSLEPTLVPTLAIISPQFWGNAIILRRPENDASQVLYHFRVSDGGIRTSDSLERATLRVRAIEDAVALAVNTRNYRVC